MEAFDPLQNRVCKPEPMIERSSGGDDRKAKQRTDAFIHSPIHGAMDIAWDIYRYGIDAGLLYQNAPLCQYPFTQNPAIMERDDTYR